MPEASAAPSGPRIAGRLAAFAAAYFLAAELGHALTIQPRAFATFWAPSGIFLAGLLLSPRRRWPLLVLAAALPSTASNLLHGRSLGTSLAFFGGNVLESLAAAALVGWAVGGARPSLGRVRDVLALVVGGAALGPAIAASAGAGLLALQGAPFGETWLLWWSGSAVGVLVVAGPALAFAAGPPPRWPGWRGAVERLAVAAAVGLAGWAIASSPRAIYSQEFVLIPPLLWAAIRTGPRGTALAGAASALLMVFASQRGLGHLAATSADTLGSLRFFLGLLLTTAMLVAAAFEERRREAAARRLIQAAIDEGADAVLVLDEDGRVRWASAALGRLVGQAPDALAGRPVWTVKPGLTEAGWAAWLDELRRRGATAAEETLPRADGRTSPYEVVGSLVDRDGALHVLVSLRDISDRRQAEAALRLAGVGTLAAGVAHEINNPLAYVIGNLAVARELVSRGPPEAGAAQGPDLAQALEDAHEGALRVRDIVRDLNLFSRQSEERGPVDPRAAARAAISMATNEVRHRARLEVHLDAAVPCVQGNEGRLAQVFLNLLVNAAQAIPEGRAGANVIRVEVRRGPDGWVVAEVSDTGTGMPPEVAARIFEPFFTTKPVGAGTGLGLAICHGLVRSMGGRMEVETEVGRGSRFRVLLPPSASPAPPEPRPKAAPAPGARRRVLVVDDEAPVARAVERLLRADFEVTTAGDARAALALVDAGADFDVVLCDLMMPEVTGMELHAELLRRGSPLAARLVFMTGGAFTEAAREFLGRVPNPRLEKPFDAEQLRRALAGDPAAAP